MKVTTTSVIDLRSIDKISLSVTLVGKYRSDLYFLMNEIQKEQANSEIMITELSLGRRVKAALKWNWSEVQSTVRRIVENYNEYKTDRKELEFFKSMDYSINIWLKFPSEYLIFFFKVVMLFGFAKIKDPRIPGQRTKF